jgi:hypothetical protein
VFTAEECAEIMRRINSRTVKSDGCWEWSARLSKHGGYARITYRQREWRASRLLMSVLHGDIPAYIFVCHRCDNPKCVRPDHLFLGTALDNSRDMIAKGRHVIVTPRAEAWQATPSLRRDDSGLTPEQLKKREDNRRWTADCNARNPAMYRARLDRHNAKRHAKRLVLDS